MFTYTGYLDESGTHGESPVTIMGGLLAHAGQWKVFEKKFSAAQKKHKFNVFHTKKFKKRDGDFKGWTDKQCEALILDFPSLIGQGLTDCICVTLDNEAFVNSYKIQDKPKKFQFDTKYGLCFRMCLYHFLLEVGKRHFKKQFPHLHIIVEDGPKNLGDATRIFLEVKKSLSFIGIDILQTITPAKKDSCGQLMMADFFAHTGFMQATGQMSAPAIELPANLPRLAKRRHTSVAHYASTPEGLANIREHMINQFVSKRKRRKQV